MSGKKAWSAEDIKTWPVVKVSLTEVRKSCGKKGCRRCESGEKHPAWLYMYRMDGKNYLMHVPRAPAPVMAEALENGRRLERQLVQNGIALLRGTKLAFSWKAQSQAGVRNGRNHHRRHDPIPS